MSQKLAAQRTDKVPRAGAWHPSRWWQPGTACSLPTVLPAPPPNFLPAGLGAAHHWLPPAGGQAHGAEEAVCGAGPRGGRQQRRPGGAAGRGRAGSRVQGTCSVAGLLGSWGTLPGERPAHANGLLVPQSMLLPAAWPCGMHAPLLAPPGPPMCRRCPVTMAHHAQVVGVVREKILFKARPRALITKPAGQK